MDRRAFLRTLGASAAVGLVRPDRILASSARRFGSAYFDLHPFIAQHPEAIFIKRTNVVEKRDAEAKRQEGLDLAREIFVLADSPGIALSHRIAIKPNLTCSVNSNYTLESGMGIVTDVDFVEGMIEGMKELGIDPDRVNVMGGGTAIGHPLGATGIRLVGTLARILKVKGGRYGLANACVGGGQGVATIIEREP